VLVLDSYCDDMQEYPCFKRSSRQNGKHLLDIITFGICTFFVHMNVLNFPASWPSCLFSFLFSLWQPVALRSLVALKAMSLAMSSAREFLSLCGVSL